MYANVFSIVMMAVSVAGCQQPGNRCSQEDEEEQAEKQTQERAGTPQESVQNKTQRLPHGRQLMRNEN
jgi:hypothetical protein